MYSLILATLSHWYHLAFSGAGNSKQDSGLFHLLQQALSCPDQAGCQVLGLTLNPSHKLINNTAFAVLWPPINIHKIMVPFTKQKNAICFYTHWFFLDCCLILCIVWVYPWVSEGIPIPIPTWVAYPWHGYGFCMGIMGTLGYGYHHG
ncbi:uncharacterized protein B0H18DRAFT_957740 [Fomitopsis serialis]|uniref:uncharacterized protein n=1 Tax=Fomitopsis serialis TaxID=139415 RepID=UPI002008362D|nr:uncharacterized protein B0H18DRAFT_957740 [Neoantrodia serialis]KAH9918979.1 hypothetical protein B0H18DRAFT_957740 [Neoantrodia serialis]